MDRRVAGLGFAGFCISCLSLVVLQAQDFKLFDREVQVHGFVSQGFVHTNTNNWLTMDSSRAAPPLRTSASMPPPALPISSGSELNSTTATWDSWGSTTLLWTGPSWITASRAGSAFVAAKSKPLWACITTRRTWISSAPLLCFRKAFTRPISATPPLLI